MSAENGRSARRGSGVKRPIRSPTSHVLFIPFLAPAWRGRYAGIIERSLRESTSRSQGLAAGTGYTFSTSSPKWLITFTAILPDLGGSNGWLVALYSFDH